MSDWRLTPENAAVVVVDVQEKLMNAMPRRAETVASIQKLIGAAKTLNIPTLVTLQYVKGLGPLVPELTELTAGRPTFEKLAFSCCGSVEFMRSIKDLRRPRVVLCGVEAHVCVQQTVIDLLADGRAVYVCADAVCSRRNLDGQLALERMRDCGAVITTVEAAVFELLRQASTEQFKACLPLFK